MGGVDQGSICAFLGFVLGQALLVLIAQGTLVLLLHLYPILPSKPTLIVCNITHTHTHTYMGRHITNTEFIQRKTDSEAAAGHRDMKETHSSPSSSPPHREKVFSEELSAAG